MYFAICFVEGLFSVRFLESTKPSDYYINLEVTNNYGYEVEVRSSKDFIEGVIVPNGAVREIKERSNSPEYLIVRVYDRRDGIPIQIGSKSYVKITPKSSPQYWYKIVVEEGTHNFSNE